MRARRWAIALCAVAAVALWPAAAVQAANRIYWSNMEANTISYANLDGSGGGNLNTAGATVDGPMGLAIDSAAGRIYWANYGDPPLQPGTSISYANLDGSGGGNFVTSGTIIAPHGLAIDSAAGRIYWTNGTSRIGFANLDGSGAGLLADPFPATVDDPRGLALDPAAGRLYWANWDANRISYDNLNEGAGADLPTGTATVVHPEGVALDPAGGRLFFSNFSETAADRISYANLDGSGGANLATDPATVSGPHGVAIDPAAGKIYWPNFDANVISYASLDGSGGGDLPTPGATLAGPDLPVLLEAPAATHAPAIHGPAKPGSTLHCTPAWAADELASLLYRAPHSLSFTWSENGHPIAGATSSVSRRRVGNYRCTVTAQNEAGDATQTSSLYPIFKVGRPKLNRRRGTAQLAVRVAGHGWLSLSGKGVRKARAASQPGASAAVHREVRGGTVKLLVRGTRATQKRLRRSGRAKVKVKVSYRPLGGERASQARTVKLRKRARR